MIVEINEDIFFNEEETILKDLSLIVRELLSGKHLWDTSNFHEYFDLIKESHWFINYLSTVEQQEFTEILAGILDKSAYITAIHRKYLTSFRIGFENGQITPTEAKILLQERSKIIVENAIGDWKFIKGVTEKYKNQKSRKTVYKLLYAAIENNWIEPENAGGKGGVQARITALLDRYGLIYQLKMATFFDSDKKTKDVILLATSYLIKFLKNISKEGTLKNLEYEDKDLIVWHILYKREMENYLPIDVIEQYYPDYKVNCEKLRLLGVEELDYIDTEEKFDGLDTKSEFPNLFLKMDWRKNLLEERCAHHPVKIETPNGILEPVSEMEELLLKLVKII